MPQVRVRLFHELRLMAGQSEVVIEAKTLGDVLSWLLAKYESLRGMILDGRGKLRSYTQIYVNNEAIDSANLEEELEDGDIVMLIPPVGGGFSPSQRRVDASDPRRWRS